MYAITGITGKVGGVVAHTLLSAGESVRAIVRSPDKGAPWLALGCEIAVAEMEDAEALTRAFEHAEAVFILPPPNFDPEPDFPEAKAVIAAVKKALEASRPERVVCLSTVGAQAAELNLLSQRTLMEDALFQLPLATSCLRPAWFTDNLSWDIPQARERGVISSFLQPLGRAIPMVASEDVGRVAAELLRQPAVAARIVELEGPAHVSPNAIAEELARALHRDVRAEAVPRESWDELFRAQGMRNPVPRMRMLDGFNEGWIDFEGSESERRRGTTSLADVVARLVE
jgi:uncharacterized protein YbjT (DUF2867 family)